jgi:DnaJ family protein C protein 7
MECTINVGETATSDAKEVAELKKESGETATSNAKEVAELKRESGETATSNAKQEAERRRERGNLLYANRKYQDAIHHYTAAIELCPDSSVYYGNRSACYLRLYQYRAALEDATKAVALDSSFVKGYIRIALCSLALGNSTIAYNALSSARKLNLNSCTVQELQELDVVIRCDKEGTTACQEKDFTKAVQCTDKILEHIPCSRYKLKKAGCLILLGRFKEAQNIANDVLHVDKQNVDAVYVRGMCFYYQDNMEKALDHFKYALRLAPNHTRAMVIYKRAKALISRKEQGNKAYIAGRLEEAYAIYTEALEIDPNNKSVNAQLFFNKATVCLRLGRLNEAVDNCSNALELDENYHKALLQRAQCYMDLRDFEKAVRDYEKAYKMNKTGKNRKLLDEAKRALKNTKDKDYYKICGVHKNASFNEIKKAYKRKALDHHPDRHIDASEDARKQEEEKFKELHEAYRTLSDVSKRARYDLSLYRRNY